MSLHALVIWLAFAGGIIVFAVRPKAPAYVQSEVRRDGPEVRLFEAAPVVPPERPAVRPRIERKALEQDSKFARAMCIRCGLG